MDFTDKLVESIAGIRQEFGYNGKPKQWQQGFDVLLRHLNDYLTLLNSLRPLMEEYKAAKKELDNITSTVTSGAYTDSLYNRLHFAEQNLLSVVMKLFEGE